MSQPGNLKGATPERLVTLKPSIPSVRIESAAVVLLYRVKTQDSHERDATTQLSANHGEITRKRQTEVATAPKHAKLSQNLQSRTAKDFNTVLGPIILSM